MILVLQYPKCSTCKKALQWLEEHGVAFESRHIVEENPTVQELELWWKKSGLPLKKFFNTSGNLYKEQNLKDKLPQMSEQEQLELLATNGMLVKRPLVITEDMVLVGFKEDQWQQLNA
jgi:arsenate reductase